MLLNVVITSLLERVSFLHFCVNHKLVSVEQLERCKKILSAGYCCRVMITLVHCKATNGSLRRWALVTLDDEKMEIDTF